MPVIPSFAHGSRRTQGPPGSTNNASSRGPPRSSPRPPSVRPDLPPSPRLAGLTARRSLTDVDGGDSAASDAGHSGELAASRSLSAESTPHQSHGGTPRDEGGVTSRSASRSASRSGDVALLSGRESAAASPGRRFMNIHRRARRGRVRGEAGSVSGSDSEPQTPVAPGHFDGDESDGPTTGDGGGTSVLHALGGTPTGASLRRVQYAAAATAVTGAGDRVPAYAGAAQSGVEGARLGASNSSVESGGGDQSSGRRSEGGAAPAAMLPPAVVPRSDITIVVAPPQVHLTTSRDALQRLAQRSAAGRPAQLPFRSSPTSGRLASTSAAPSSNATPATPTERRAAAESSDRQPPTAHNSNVPDVAATWQLPVLTAVRRGHVTHPAEWDDAPSLRSASASSSGGERGHSSGGSRASSVASQLRSVASGSGGASGSRRTVSFTSGSREVSWARDAVDGDGGAGAAASAHAPAHRTAGLPSAGDRGRRGLSQSAPSGLGVSTTSLRRVVSGVSLTSSSFAAAAGAAERRSAVDSSLVASPSPSSVAAGASGLPQMPAAPPRSVQWPRSPAGNVPLHFYQRLGATDAVGRSHRGAEERAASRSVSAHAGAASSLRGHRPSRPPSPLQTAALIPTAAAGPAAATEHAAEFSAGEAMGASVQLPAATDGVVLLNHVHNAAAQGELYRLLRVLHPEPLQHFPEALRGPPLAVRLPGGVAEVDGAGEAAGGWGHGPQSRSRSGSSASASAVENAYGVSRHRSRSRSRSRSPLSTHRGRSSSSTSSTSHAMVEVDASHPRALFTRLVSDPDDRTVAVRNVPSAASSALSTSPRRSRRGLATTSGGRRAVPSTASTSHAERSLDEGQPHSAFIASAGVRAAAPIVAQTGTYQAELVANGFFNAEVRLGRSRRDAEAATAAEEEYGEGCYYTLPLIPLSGSPQRSARPAVVQDVITEAVHESTAGDAEDDMEQLPRLAVRRTISSRVQRSRQRTTASTGSGCSALSAPCAPVDASNESISGRANAAPSRTTPEPPTPLSGRPEQPNPRAALMKGVGASCASSCASPTSPAQRGGREPRIHSASSEDLQQSRLNERVAVQEGEYAPMHRILDTARSPMRRRRSGEGGSEG